MTLEFGFYDKDVIQPYFFRVFFLPNQTATTDQDFLKQYQIIFIFTDSCKTSGFCSFVIFTL